MRRVLFVLVAVFSIAIFTPFIYAQDTVDREEVDVVNEESQTGNGEEDMVVSPQDEDEETPMEETAEDEEVGEDDVDEDGTETIGLENGEEEGEGVDWVLIISLGAVAVVAVIIIAVLAGGKQ